MPLWTYLEELRQNLRYSARTLRRTPLFTTVAVLSLALGIGANTAALSTLSLALAALLATLIPAWRAARVDPLSALRHE